MGYLVGVDEAGYGPRLGPLVVTASAWRVPGDPQQCDLYELAPAAVAAGEGRAEEQDARPRIADSKLVFNRQQGLAGLEQGVLPVLAQRYDLPRRWSQLCELLDPGALDKARRLPWHAAFDVELPVGLAAPRLTAMVCTFARGAAAAGVELVDVRSRVIYPREFNRLVADCGNKATALSELSIGLLQATLGTLGEGPIFAVCDKHGGRNFYAGLLQHYSGAAPVRAVSESQAESRYAVCMAQRPLQVAFRRHGETSLPVAYSSMVSKYVRELSMLAWNEFWCSRLPGLRPTAGYGADAARFAADIAPLQRDLRIDSQLLWRER